METSQYFEQTLFHERSPATNEYYGRAADIIFETNLSLSKVEVRIQSTKDLSAYERQGVNRAKEKQFKDELQTRAKRGLEEISESKLNSKCPVLGCSSQIVADPDACSLSSTISQVSSASSTALPTVLDQHRGGSSPPSYPGLPKLTIVDLDISRLSEFLKKTKQDFRVFYLRQRHSNSRIQITKELFEDLLRICHVFPRFNEYVIGFGVKDSESEIGPPPLKFRPLCDFSRNSFRGFECAYILRYVEFTNRSGIRHPKYPWSLRQFAVYHRYKPKSQTWCSTWILVGASQRTEERLENYTRSIEDLTMSNPFELHVIFLDTAIASWRPYLVDLTKQVTHQSNKAVGVTIGAEESQYDLFVINVEDHQALKEIEDRIADLILCIDSTSDTVSTFQDMYRQFCNNQKNPRLSNEPTIDSAYGTDAVIFALKEKIKELAYTRKKAEALLSKVQNTRTLISSLLERQTGHTLDRQISALHNLERQAQDENSVMRDIAKKNSRDSSTMKILTIIFLIYLPSTVVSNFYSTQFVTQKDSDSGGFKLVYSQNFWLFFAISLPLTIVTILIWFLWSNVEKLLQFFLRRSNTREIHLNNTRETLESHISYPRLPR